MWEEMRVVREDAAERDKLRINWKKEGKERKDGERCRDREKERDNETSRSN